MVRSPHKIVEKKIFFYPDDNNWNEAMYPHTLCDASIWYRSQQNVDGKRNRVFTGKWLVALRPYSTKQIFREVWRSHSSVSLSLRLGVQPLPDLVKCVRLLCKNRLPDRQSPSWEIKFRSRPKYSPHFVELLIHNSKMTVAILGHMNPAHTVSSCFS